MAQKKDHNRYKILVVEDDQGQNEALCKIVSKVEGCEAISAHDGIHALKVLDDHERGFGFMKNGIDLILLDYQMPNMTGEEFIRHLRTQEHKRTRHQYIPIVIVSAYSDSTRWNLAKNSVLGMASGYIVKPYDAEFVMDVVRRIVILKEAETLREMLRHQETTWFRQEMAQFSQRFQTMVQPEESPKTLAELEARVKETKQAYEEALADYDRFKHRQIPISQQESENEV